MWAASSRTAARSGSMASTSGKGEGAVSIAPPTSKHAFVGQVILSMEFRQTPLQTALSREGLSVMRALTGLCSAWGRGLSPRRRAERGMVGSATHPCLLEGPTSGYPPGTGRVLTFSARPLPAGQQPVAVLGPPWAPVAHGQLGAAQAAEVLKVPARRNPREPRLIRHVGRSEPRASTAQDPDDQLQCGVRQALGEGGAPRCNTQRPEDAVHFALVGHAHAGKPGVGTGVGGQLLLEGGQPERLD